MGGVEPGTAPKAVKRGSAAVTRMGLEVEVVRPGKLGKAFFVYTATSLCTFCHDRLAGADTIH